MKGGWKTVIAMPEKHLVMQAAMKTHLSQPIGAGAFDGQHGMSVAIASAAVSSVIACIDASEDVSAMTGRDNGANASPAITKIESSRRMVIWLFTSSKSHKLGGIDSLQG
jgi:hypothetical protein